MLKKLSDCRNDMLSLFYSKLSELKTCETLVKKYLSEKVAKQCTVTDIQQDCITIMATNSSILSLLRYEKPELLRKLRTEEKMHALKTIDLKLTAATPYFSEPTHRQPNTIALSEKSFESIRTTANSCQHKPLKEALQQLEKTLRDKANKAF